MSSRRESLYFFLLQVRGMRSRIEKVLIDESEEAYGTTTEQTGAGRPGATYEPESYGKRLWHLWGPVVIWLVIGILVSMIAEYALTSVYIVSHYGNELNQGAVSAR